MFRMAAAPPLGARAQPVKVGEALVCGGVQLAIVSQLPTAAAKAVSLAAPGLQALGDRTQIGLLPADGCASSYRSSPGDHQARAHRAVAAGRRGHPGRHGHRLQRHPPRLHPGRPARRAGRPAALAPGLAPGCRPMPLHPAGRTAPQARWRPRLLQAGVPAHPPTRPPRATPPATAPPKPSPGTGCTPGCRLVAPGSTTAVNSRVRRGFRHLRVKTARPADVPSPSKPGSGRPPGWNHRPAPRHEPSKTVKRIETLAEHVRPKQQ
jgi:hypothetical protein